MDQIQIGAGTTAVTKGPRRWSKPSTLLGLLLILLVSVALVSAVAIVILIELGWIVRLAARVYWRWRSSVAPPQDGTEQDAPRTSRRRLTYPNGDEGSERRRGERG